MIDEKKGSSILSLSSSWKNTGMDAVWTAGLLWACLMWMLLILVSWRAKGLMPPHRGNSRKCKQGVLSYLMISHQAKMLENWKHGL